MGEHLVLSVDHLIKSESLHAIKENGVDELSEGGCCSHKTDPCTTIDIADVDKNVEAGEEEPLINVVECRICQEEDGIKNLETPCSCSGSLKFAHRECVQRWCNEKGDIICEICHQPYQPNYTAPPLVLLSEDTSDVSGELHDARLLAIAAERHLLDADYDEYADTNTGGAAFCRSAVLILMTLLLLKHALNINYGDDDDEVSAFFSLLLVRVGGFLLPCYFLAWAISIIQRRRQRQEEEAPRAANEVAFLIQAGQRRGLRFTITPGPTATPNPEPVS